MEETNNMIKICVNMFINDKFIGEYDDAITNKYLIAKINNFINTVSHFNNKNISYCYFQKSNVSNDYAILMAITKQFNNLREIETLLGDNNLVAFGYFLQNNGSDVTYLTKKTRLTNNYYNFNWDVSINSFIQANAKTSSILHETVMKYILEYGDYRFFGIGGESPIYEKMFRSQTKSQFNSGHTKNICVTNSKNIYDDAIFNNNQLNIHLVDYNNFELVKYIDNPTKYILLVNISTNGLRDLAKQINEMHFIGIIYIGCSNDAIRRDINNLSNYKIIADKHIFQSKDKYIYVGNFIYEKN